MVNNVDSSEFEQLGRMYDELPFTSCRMPGTKPGPPRPPDHGRDLDAETSLELVRRARGGDRDAENAICARYRPRLERWARGQLPRGARPALETGDVVQEVLIRAVRHFSSFDPQHEHSFGAYLRTILKNRLLDLARQGQRRPPPTSLDSAETDRTVSPEPSPLDLAADAEQRLRFEAGVQRLAPRDQELVFLRVELGCSYDEMAAMIGGTANAIRVATRRAMLRLAKLIG